jgi:hypothetical protein
MNNKIKEDQTGRVCSKNGMKRMHIVYWWESQVHQYEGGWITLKLILDRIGTY